MITRSQREPKVAITISIPMATMIRMKKFMEKRNEYNRSEVIATALEQYLDRELPGG